MVPNGLAAEVQVGGEPSGGQGCRREREFRAGLAAAGDGAVETELQIGRSGKFIGQQAIQLHGGIGMTQEAKIGHYFKRLTMIENTFGDTDYHLRRVTESGGLV